MVFDRSDHESDHEPDEWDPEEEFADPDSDSLTIPRVGTEDAGSTLRSDLGSELEDDLEVPEVGDVDVDPAVARAFWGLVLVINAAGLSLALGAMLLFFRGWSIEGGALLGGGAILAGFAAYRFRSARRTVAAATDDGEPAGPETPDDASDANETPSGGTTEHRPPDDDTRR